MRALVIWVGIVLLGVQTATAQDPGSTADIAGRPSPASLTCACEERQRLVRSCGDVVLVRVEEQTSVRFGRKAGLALPRALIVLRPSTGHYVVVPEEGLFDLIVENMPDGVSRFRLVAHGQSLAAITALVKGEERSLWCASNAGLLLLASVRDFPLTPGP